MIEEDRLVSPLEGDGDQRADRALRPLSLGDYRGQPAVREQMEIFIEAARARGDALDHTLIFGPPGLGKQFVRRPDPSSRRRVTCSQR